MNDETAPQPPFLWSIWEEVSYHKRRDTQKFPVRSIEAAGFKVLRIKRFITRLLSIVLLSRLDGDEASYAERADELSNLEFPRSVNILFKNVCQVERKKIR
jgi:hypothetical protein